MTINVGLEFPNCINAKILLKGLLEQRGLKVEALEAWSPNEALARVQIPGEGVRIVTAEVADEDSGLWSGDADTCHPCCFSFPGGMPALASKVESMAASFIHVNFSPDGQSAIMFLGKDLPRHGKLRAAAKGEEAVYVIPLSHCVILHRSPRGHRDHKQH
jgi:hypothetical protein